VWRQYRSELVPVGKTKVEMISIAPQVNLSALAPGVLLIHGDDVDGRRMIPTAWLIANEGYAVTVVSQPGYGRSEGSPDFAGPATMRAVNAAFDHVRRTPGVDSNRVAVWGAARGATAAMLLAARRREVRGVVVESGIYDLWATHRGTKAHSLAEAIAREAGRDSAAWRARSPVMFADSIRTPVFIAHGELDERAPFPQAKEMAARLQGAGAPVEARFLPHRGRSVASPDLTRDYFEFLKRVQSPQ
jgi:dipeptidyl aminopeptidase/acylaminoacyl peptidase